MLDLGTPIAQGRTAEVYRYEPGKILKLYRAGFPAAAIEEEYEAAGLVSSFGLSVPRMYGKVEFDDRIGIVFDHAEGMTLLKRILSKPWAAAACARLMAELHARMHRQPAKLGRNQQDALRDSITRAPLLEEGEKDLILKYLETLQPANQLCHGDFHPDNILVGEQKWVIDWMNAMSGNPAGDVARTVLLLGHGSMPEGIPAFQRRIIQLVRSVLRNSYLKHYLKISGILRADVERWMLPVAAARLTEWLPEAEKLAIAGLVRNELQKLQ